VLKFDPHLLRNDIVHNHLLSNEKRRWEEGERERERADYANRRGTDWGRDKLRRTSAHLRSYILLDDLLIHVGKDASSSTVYSLSDFNRLSAGGTGSEKKWTHAQEKGTRTWTPKHLGKELGIPFEQTRGEIPYREKGKVLRPGK